MERVKYAIILVFLSFFLSAPVQASESGINIGTNYGDAPAAIDILNPGGWLVVIMGGTGDCKNVQTILDLAKGKVNVIIRGHLNNTLTPPDALAWAATLGKLRTPDKLYFMPWNEPNQNGSSDYANPRVLANYTDALTAALSASGLRGSKIVLLSPMLNEVNISNLTPDERTRYCSDPDYDMADFDCYVEKLKRINSGYFQAFDGISMNLYDLSRQFCGNELCSDNRHYNPARFRENLALMGASGKEVYGVESGTAGENFYWKTSPNSSSPLYNFVNNFYGKGEKMFAIPSYDLAGEAGHSWRLIPSDVSGLIGTHRGGGTSPAGSYETQLNGWLDPLVANGTLIPCPGGCGYAHKDNPGLCSATSNGGVNENCNPGSLGDRTSRPNECQVCNKTPKMTNACATTMEVTDKVSWQRKDGDICSVSPNPRTVQTTWGGDITLDYSDVTIPFVGKKGLENGQARPPKQGENGYLADYFDGTSGYYKDYNKYWLDVVNYSGVLRKLTPMVYQDRLKIKMVTRVNQSLRTATNFEGKVHDYRVTVKSRYCWDAPFWLDLMRAIFARVNPLRLGGVISAVDINHFCLFDDGAQRLAVDAVATLINGFNIVSPLKIPTRIIKGGQMKISEFNGHLPPSLDDPDYIRKYDEWRNKNIRDNFLGIFDTAIGPWGRFWEAIPMTSRENTEGKITPYLAAKTGDTLKITDDTSKKNQTTKVPHVARLYESSFLINQILKSYPASSKITLENPTPNSLLASADTSAKFLAEINTQVPQGQVLGVSPGGHTYSMDITPSVVNVGGDTYDVCWTFLANADCGLFDLHGVLSADLNGNVFYASEWGVIAYSFPYHCSYQPFGGNQTITAQPGDRITISNMVDGINHQCNDGGGNPEDPRPYLTGSVTCIIQPDKSVRCNNTVIPPIPPSCYPKDAPQIDTCVKDLAITDSNPNDKLCCGKTTIKATLTAKDIFENKQYTPEIIRKCQAYSNYHHYDISHPEDPCYDAARPGPSGEINCDESDFEPEYQVTNVRCVEDIDQEAYRWVGTNIIPDYETVTRKVGVSLSHPYLSRIWNNTAGGAGVFDNFRPFDYASFEPVDAYSYIAPDGKGAITYEFKDSAHEWSKRCSTSGSPSKTNCSSNYDASVQPNSGKFYYPYLGGIQFSKLWMTNTLKPHFDPTMATGSAILFTQ